MDDGENGSNETVEQPPEGISGGDAPRNFAEGAQPSDTEGEATEDWSPPKYDPETGVYHDGDHELPINHRLRAEALVAAGETTDPGKLITDELIADTADRLDRERKARPPVRENMKTTDLERIAKNEGIDLTSANNNTERVAAIMTARGEVL